MKREDLNFFLQQAPKNEVNLLSCKIEQHTRVKIIQMPTRQTLLVPVKDPVNGGKFFGGELLCTSTIVEVNGSNGWAMVMDENIELSKSIATLDGAFAADIKKQEIITLAEEGRLLFEKKKEKTDQQVEDTRVSFDLL